MGISWIEGINQKIQSGGMIAKSLFQYAYN